MIGQTLGASSWTSRVRTYVAFNHRRLHVGVAEVGRARVQVLISPKGRVEKARVIRSLDRQLGLDQEALTAAKRWRFRPASRRGEPVAVVAVIQLSFTTE